MNHTLPTPPAQDGRPGPRRPVWLVWVILAAILGAFWLWQSSHKGSDHPEVAYSTAYGWIESGKVTSVVLAGKDLQGVLKEPESIEGHPVDRFHARIPDQDESLVPLLRQKKVEMRVAAEGKSAVVQVLLAVLPWILIIGVWVWLSRRAKGMMMAGGGPLGVFLKRGKRF